MHIAIFETGFMKLEKKEQLCFVSLFCLFVFPCVCREVRIQGNHQPVNLSHTIYCFFIKFDNKTSISFNVTFVAFVTSNSVCFRMRNLRALFGIFYTFKHNVLSRLFVWLSHITLAFVLCCLVGVVVETVIFWSRTDRESFEDGWEYVSRCSCSWNDAH